MRADKAKAAAIRDWWGKAEESLASAERELGAGSLTFAANRLYYAAFYAASAVLLHLGHACVKHNGVRAAFQTHLVGQGMLDGKWGRLYDRLFADREEGDYITLVSFDPDYLFETLHQVRELLAAMRPRIASVLD